MSAEINADPGGRHVYHLSPARLLTLPLVCALLGAALFGAVLSGGPASRDDIRAMLLTAGVLAVIVLPFCAIVWQSRLVLSPEGIAHHQLGYTVRSRWGNLEALRLDPGAEALLLREPGTRSTLLALSARTLGLARVPPGLVGDTRSLGAGRLIFLAPFMAHWKRGPLREDLQRWAPHLFSASGEPQEGRRHGPGFMRGGD